MSEENALPTRMSFPKTVAYRIFRWCQVALFTCLTSGFVVMFVVSGEWWGAAIFAPIFLMIVVYGWAVLTEKLELQEAGFDYSVGFSKWRYRWSECAGFRHHDDWWRGVRWVSVCWVSPRPEFTFGKSAPASEARLFSTFEMKARDLAALMDDFRIRSLGAPDRQ